MKLRLCIGLLSLVLVSGVQAGASDSDKKSLKKEQKVKPHQQALREKEQQLRLRKLQMMANQKRKQPMKAVPQMRGVGDDSAADAYANFPKKVGKS